MLFKGTPTRPPGSSDTMIEGFGGASNAYTSYDTTHYDFVVPVEHLRAGVELLADLATHASFPPNEIDNEKKVVFEEMNLIEDDPEKFLLRRLYEVSYSPHPYGRPLLGQREFIQKLTRDQLARFYRKHFVPGTWCWSWWAPWSRPRCGPWSTRPSAASRPRHRRRARLRRRPRSTGHGGPTSGGPRSRRTWAWRGGPRRPATRTSMRWTCSRTSSATPRARA